MDTIRNIVRAHESSDCTIEELQEALLKEIRIFETSLQTSISRRSHHFEETPSLPTASFTQMQGLQPTAPTNALVAATVRAVRMPPPTVIQWALNQQE